MQAVAPSTITFLTPTGNFSRWQTDDIFSFFPENNVWHFMQEDLHEMSNPFF